MNFSFLFKGTRNAVAQRRTGVPTGFLQ